MFHFRQIMFHASKTTSSKFDMCMLAKRGGMLANVDTEFHRLSQNVVGTWAIVFIILVIINLVVAF
jgi:hypothetical protein